MLDEYQAFQLDDPGEIRNSMQFIHSPTLQITELSILSSFYLG